MAEKTAETLAAEAEAFCRGSFWGVEHTYRYLYGNSKGNTVVRYADNVPDEIATYCTAYLRTDSALDFLTIEGHTLAQAGYRTLYAGWEAVGSAADKGIRFKRLVHVLGPAANDAADVTSWTVTGNGCTYRVSVQEYDNLAELPTLPSSASGVTYAINGISRDGETGLYDCWIEKREQLTTTTGWMTVKDDADAAVTECTWLGVRSDAGGAYTLDSDGNAVAFPSVGISGLAETEIVGVTKNDNCTADIRFRTVTSKTGDRRVVERERTLYLDRERVTDTNKTEAVDAYVEVANGTVYDRRSEKQANGLYTNTQETRTARPVTGFFKRWASTLFEHQTETRDQNQDADTPADPAADPEGTITEHHATENENGKWELANIVRVAKHVTSTLLSFYEDYFGKHTVEEERNADTGKTAGTTRTDGKIVTERSQKNEFKKFDNSTETDECTERLGYVKRYERTFFSHQQETQDIHGSSEAALPDAMKDVSGVRNGTITHTESEKDKWGKVHYIKSEDVAEERINAHVTFSATAFERVRQYLTRNANNRITDGGLVDVTNATIVERVAEANSHGVFDNTQTQRSAIAVAGTTQGEQADADEFDTTAANRNQSEKDATASTASDGNYGVNIENFGQNYLLTVTEGVAQWVRATIRRVRSVMNEFKTWDTQVETEKPTSPWQRTFTTLNEDGDTVYTILFGNYEGGPTTHTFSDGTTTNMLQHLLNTVANCYGRPYVSARRNKFGLFDGMITARIRAEVKSAGSAWRSETHEWCYTTTETVVLGGGRQATVTVIHALGYNQVTGAELYYNPNGRTFNGVVLPLTGATRYPQWSWFRTLGRNWWMFDICTAYEEN